MIRPTAPAALSTLVLALGLSAFTAVPAAAASPPAYADAVAQFQRAADGQTSAIDDAAAQWRALSEAEPADPVRRAFAGAATSMRAQTTLLPWRKLSHAEDGLALLDKALAQLTPAHDTAAHHGAPAGLVVRFTAASTFLSLPPMFNRGARGARLLDEVLHSPQFGEAPADFRAQVWLRAGLEAAKDKRSDEARLWLQKAAASGTPHAARAQARLVEL